MSELTEQEKDELYQVYAYLYGLKANERKTNDEIKAELLEQGMSDELADSWVSRIDSDYRQNKRNMERYKNQEKSSAYKNMIYGGLWFTGGLIMTLANVGYIFYGAIIIGFVQFFVGLIDVAKSN